jgi:hypothetical protein
MVNLLPVENKVSIKKEYLRRLVVVFGLFSFVTIIIAILLLVFLLFLVNKEKNDYSTYLSLEKKHLTFLDEEEVVSFVTDTNSKTAVFEKNSKESKKASDTIEKIIKAKTKGITIDRFSLNGGDMSFSGTAQIRSDLSFFIDNLKKEPSFEKVDSPISNFLKENDINFNISIILYEK